MTQSPARRTRWLLAICASWLLTASATAVAAEATLHITNARVFDVDAGRFSEPSTVEIVEDRIGRIHSGAVPEDAGSVRSIDAEGGYLLPGFVDLHAHILIPACRRDADGRPMFDEALSAVALKRTLDAGVTTVRSPATPTVQGLNFRDQINLANRRGVPKSPFILAASEFINDRHLGPAGIRQRIREDAVHRPDFIKLYSNLPEPMVRAGIEEAHRLGIPVIGHLGATSWRAAADAGIDQLTHALDFSLELIPPERRSAVLAARRSRGAIRARIDWLEAFDPDGPAADASITTLAQAGVSIDPTLVAYESKFSVPGDRRFLRNPVLTDWPALRELWTRCGSVADDWTDTDRQRWASARPKLHRWLRRLAAAGIRLGVGTDAANPGVIPGLALHQELELLVEAGFEPAEVLRMATINAAQALRLDATIGRVATGHEADLILLRQDPLADIRNSRDLAWVMANGHLRQASSWLMETERSRQP